ncbi:hypothetical protein FQR65_LT16013 [Abscondita terminalis]|nr:hypothetical protein FQR65_LT16013 [Abscondita terminalis]
MATKNRSFEKRMFERKLKKIMERKFEHPKPTKRIKLEQVGYVSRRSPETVITKSDERVFREEVLPSYGVEPSAQTVHEQECNNERKRLLAVTQVPLNNSGSKWVSIGLDPFRNFQPVVRITKSKIDLGVTLTRSSYEEFSKELGAILDGLKNDSLPVTYIGNYEITLIRGQEMCKFTHVKPATSNDFFELYIMHQSLNNFCKMEQFILNVFNDVSKMVCKFDSFCDDVAESVQSGNGVESALEEILKSKYGNDNLLHELYYRFRNFVINSVKDLIILCNQNAQPL